ncbi:MAG TPA: asparaginase, partial [Candidatus Acidoferrum sp.]|nr:asparaginase [Candidatus Acidoferrum sp.]
MSRVAIVFTGGTISMAVDPVAGGNVPTLDGAAIIARTPWLSSIADVVAVDRGRTPASHFTLQALVELYQTIRSSADDPAVDGVVVVQGTDSIEESSFCWDLLHSGSKPIVVTGAMRSSSEPGYDGPANLADAVRCAASPSLADAGVVVVLAGEIHAADDVAKMHTRSMTTFQSPNLGALGTVADEGVRIRRIRAGRRHVSPRAAAEPVYLVTAVTGDDGRLVDAAVGYGARGIVVAATGGGNTSPALLDAGKRAMDAGIPVVLVSRVPSGAAGTGYAFPGGGATWVRAGAILGGSLSGPKARVALSLGVGAGLDHDALAVLL